MSEGVRWPNRAGQPRPSLPQGHSGPGIGKGIPTRVPFPRSGKGVFLQGETATLLTDLAGGPPAPESPRSRSGFPVVLPAKSDFSQFGPIDTVSVFACALQSLPQWISPWSDYFSRGWVFQRGGNLEILLPLDLLIVFFVPAVHGFLEIGLHGGFAATVAPSQILQFRRGGRHQ